MTTAALDLDWLRARFPDRLIYWHNTIGSTMSEAARLAVEGCPSGTVVGAEEQTAGQGRYGRQWHSEVALGLYHSIVLRYRFAPATLPVVTMALGLAVAEAVQKATDLVCDLRWPNDLLLAGLKCCGILTHFDGQAILAGIGLNVNHESFPDPLSGVATSLRIAAGRTFQREKILVELWPSIDAHCVLLEQQGVGPILEMFTRASSFVSGRRVIVEQDGAILRGTTEGLDSAGFLILREEDGRRTVVLAGGVRPA